MSEKQLRRAGKNPAGGHGVGGVARPDTSPRVAKKGSGELAVTVRRGLSLPRRVRAYSKSLLAPNTGLFPGNGRLVDAATPSTPRSTKRMTERKASIRVPPLPVSDGAR
jgi:hypothetical protein